MFSLPPRPRPLCFLLSLRFQNWRQLPVATELEVTSQLCLASQPFCHQHNPFPAFIPRRNAQRGVTQEKQRPDCYMGPQRGSLPWAIFSSPLWGVGKGHASLYLSTQRAAARFSSLTLVPIRSSSSPGAIFLGAAHSLRHACAG